MYGDILMYGEHSTVVATELCRITSACAGTQNNRFTRMCIQFRVLVMAEMLKHVNISPIFMPTSCVYISSCCQLL
jgi:hypothetical protein